MGDYCNNEWADLCKRTRLCASFNIEKSPGINAGIETALEDFCALTPPEYYTDLLERTSQARDLAVSWMEAKNDED